MALASSAVVGHSQWFVDAPRSAPEVGALVVLQGHVVAPAATLQLASQDWTQPGPQPHPVPCVAGQVRRAE